MKSAANQMILAEMLEAIKEAHVSARRLSEEEARHHFDMLSSVLGVDFDRDRTPWDDLKAPKGLRYYDGWKIIPEFVGNERCFLAIDNVNLIWSVNNGTDLLRILTAWPELEFYVWNESCDYLICFNDHEYIIGWGNAEGWIEQLRLR